MRRRDDRQIFRGGDDRPPVLVLEEGPSRRTRGWRLTAVLLLVAALVGAYLGRDTVERLTGLELPDASDVVERVERFRSGASSTAALSGPGDSTSARRSTAEGVSAGPGGDGEPDSVAVVERRLDSLAVVLDRYRERHGDFVRGRLGCRGLIRGFTEVEDRFAAASQAFGRLEAEGGGESVAAGGLGERYRRLSSTTDSLGRLYVASGCAGEEEATE